MKLSDIDFPLNIHRLTKFGAFSLGESRIGLDISGKYVHGSALVGSDPHELAPGFEVVCQKGIHIGVSELTLFEPYEIELLRI